MSDTDGAAGTENSIPECLSKSPVTNDKRNSNNSECLSLLELITYCNEHTWLTKTVLTSQLCAVKRSHCFCFIVSFPRGETQILLYAKLWWFHLSFEMKGI